MLGAVTVWEYASLRTAEVRVVFTADLLLP